MSSFNKIDVDVLKEFQPGPRYTSYPNRAAFLAGVYRAGLHAAKSPRPIPKTKLKRRFRFTFIFRSASGSVISAAAI